MLAKFHSRSFIINFYTDYICYSGYGASLSVWKSPTQKNAKATEKDGCLGVLCLQEGKARGCLLQKHLSAFMVNLSFTAIYFPVCVWFWPWGFY